MTTVARPAASHSGSHFGGFLQVPLGGSVRHAGRLTPGGHMRVWPALRSRFPLASAGAAGVLLPPASGGLTGGKVTGGLGGASPARMAVKTARR